LKPAFSDPSVLPAIVEQPKNMRVRAHGDGADVFSGEEKLLIENRLREAMQHAKDEYEKSKEELRSLGGNRELAAPAALNLAIQGHKHAFDKYRKALEDFNRFVLFGVIPPKPPSSDAP
jgi:hypothetical protein